MSSVWCSWRCLVLRPEKEQRYEKAAFSRAWRILWRPVLSTSVLAFMAGFMLQVATLHPIPLNVFQGTALVTQFAVVFILLVPALLVKKAFALESVYKAPCLFLLQVFCCCRLFGTGSEDWRTHVLNWVYSWRVSFCGAWWPMRLVCARCQVRRCFPSVCCACRLPSWRARCSGFSGRNTCSREI